MLDNWERFQQMEDQALSSEIERLTKLLFKQRTGSALYRQIAATIHMAKKVAGEKNQIKQFREANKTPKSQILDIGEIESITYTPDYNRVELLDAVVQAYLHNPENPSD
jgi:hypothetical protein